MEEESIKFQPNVPWFQSAELTLIFLIVEFAVKMTASLKRGRLGEIGRQTLNARLHAKVMNVSRSD